MLNAYATDDVAANVASGKESFKNYINEKAAQLASDIERKALRYKDAVLKQRT